ncbi:MAG: hypothetical protein FJ404_13020 [Verrucomicrobia bacterium]|nr:hypothetical protein [Verrucomicrobiota bacterium]
MRSRIREDPQEWRKFTLSFGLMLGLVLWIASRRGMMAPSLVWVAIGLLSLGALTAVLRPVWCRGFHRAGMRAGMAVGGVVVAVMLALLFVLMVVPMGWIMRRFGYDPLGLSPRLKPSSHWKASARFSSLDRLF